MTPCDPDVCDALEAQAAADLERIRLELDASGIVGPSGLTASGMTLHQAAEHAAAAVAGPDATDDHMREAAACIGLHLAADTNDMAAADYPPAAA